jgi:imidazolonepropionase-like amidohydrolase
MRNTRLSASALLLWLTFFPGAAPAHASETETARALAIVDVTLIDVADGRARPGMTVIVSGDRIVAVGRTRKIRTPEGAQLIGGQGKFLIPGLWDAHVHLGSNEALLPIYLANGVTSVRSMADRMEQIADFRSRIAEGKLMGPRIVATGGPIVDGPRPLWEGSIIAATSAQGSQAVTQVRQSGADFIKVYEMLPKEAYLAIAGEARKQGLAFAGHVPRSLSAGEASAAGQSSIEHLLGIPLAGSSREAELREKLLAASAEANPGVRATAYFRADGEAYASQDAEKSRSLFETFVKNQTRVVPTLTNARAFTQLDKTDLASDPRMKYMPQSLLGFWNAVVTWQLTPEEKALRQARFDRQLALVRAMNEAGVEILAGTDAPNPLSFPGFGLHDELSLLTGAGLTPAQALQAATRNPARLLGRLDSLGTIEQGKLADLVLLEANPLDKIEHTRLIGGVIANGRYFSKDRLQAMLKPRAAD